MYGGRTDWRNPVGFLIWEIRYRWEYRWIKCQGICSQSYDVLYPDLWSVGIAFLLPNIVTSAVLMVSMLIQLTVAIKKGWYRVPVKRTIVILWVTAIALPLVLLFALYSLHLLAAYQEARLQAYFTQSGDAFYLTSVLRSFSENLAWFGKSSNVMGVGCGMVLLLNIVINLFSSLGWIPPASSFLPFFSVGRSNMILCYALIGVVMKAFTININL